LDYIAQHAQSLEHALELVASGVPNIISRVPLLDLMSRAALVRHGLFDFDGTLIGGSQWRALGELMPEYLREADLENARWYRSQRHGQHEQDSSLEDPDWWIDELETGNTLAVDGAWVASTVAMLALSGVTWNDIEHAAATLPARAGAVELIRLMDQRAVVSFGIEQFIQAWLLHHGLRVPVAATRLLYDSSGRVERPHINIVGAGSKKFAAARFRRLANVEERSLLVVGDSVVDVHMMGEDSFNVLVVPRTEVDHKLQDFRENNLEVMWERITMILFDDSLESLVDLLREARE